MKKEKIIQENFIQQIKQLHKEEKEEIEPKSLHDIIMQQAQESSFNPDRQLCEYLLLQIDKNGYFTSDYKTIIKGSKFPPEVVKKTIALLRTFTPKGCFSFNLKECLQIQCKLSREPISEVAFTLCENLEEILLQKNKHLQRKHRLSRFTLIEAILFLHTLNPQPANEYTHQIMEKEVDFKVELVEDQLQILYYDPTIQLFFSSFDILNSTTPTKSKYNALLVMQYLCEYQQDFFLHNAPIHYLTLEMVAKKCNLHTSMIYKIIEGKLFLFQNKQYTLKSLLNSNGVQGVNASTIQQYIIHYIQEEDKSSPLSDEKIRILLEEDHKIKISRRTVVKYREACLILNSQKRKR